MEIKFKAEAADPVPVGRRGMVNMILTLPSYPAARRFVAVRH